MKIQEGSGRVRRYEAINMKKEQHEQNVNKNERYSAELYKARKTALLKEVEEWSVLAGNGSTAQLQAGTQIDGDIGSNSSEDWDCRKCAQKSKSLPGTF